MHKRLQWTKIQFFIVNATDKIGLTYIKNHRIIRIDLFINICLQLVNVSGFVFWFGGSSVICTVVIECEREIFNIFFREDPRQESFISIFALSTATTSTQIYQTIHFNFYDIFCGGRFHFAASLLHAFLVAPRPIHKLHVVVLHTNTVCVLTTTGIFTRFLWNPKYWSNIYYSCKKN